MRRPTRSARRKFISLAGASLLGAALNGCKEASSLPWLAPSPTTPPTPTPSGHVTLQGDGADIWAWQVQVSGQTEQTNCSGIIINANQQPIEAAMQNNQFKANIPIQEGENRVTARCEPDGPDSQPLLYTGRLRNTPNSTIDIQIKTDSILLDGSGSQPAPGSGTPIRQYTWTARPANPAAISILSPGELAGKNLTGAVHTPRLEIALPAVDGEYYLSLMVTDEAGSSDTSSTYFIIDDGKPRLDDWSWQNTAWVENAIVYGVIPRKFGRQAFLAIIDRLDKLQELGVNALWLAPINPSPAGDYGYAVIDYFGVREESGTKEDFRRMVQEAHKRGIRVLMDFVPNHSSDQHPYFLDANKNGPSSHYWDFYARDENGQPTHYFDWTNLPNLNYDNPEVRQWITEAFAYWVREYDVDGFRTDAAWGIRERKPDFWPEWRKALKRIKPDLLLLAEASARDAYYFTNGFDAAYDWTGQLGHWAWEKVFEDKKLLLYNLNIALTNNRAGFDPDALIFRFLNNNDTGERFITKYGLPMFQVASVLLLTLPGIPCIYTGDEVGAEYSPYDDPMPLFWQDKLHLFDYYKKVIHLRRDTPALRSRKWQIVEVEPHLQVYAYVRYTETGTPPALVLLNFSDQPLEAEVKLPDAFAGLIQAGQLNDLLSGETLTIAEKASVSMLPMSARILVK